jgi:hypothetical protein
MTTDNGQPTTDKTGFPLLRIPQPQVDVQLLPVTKVQFERFLAEPNQFGDVWYEEVLSLNPRVSYRRFTAEHRERLFLTGILPEEALAFARWLGSGFDLPTVEEWGAIYTELEKAWTLPSSLADFLAQRGTHPAAMIIQRLTKELQPQSLLDLSLMPGGVVEWVRQGNSWVGLGAPRPKFHPNVWSPLEVRSTRSGERLKFLGFRLVRRIG